MHGMNENIKAGAEIHEGGGYSEGTQEAYEAFAKQRNQSLAKARIQQLAEQATDVVEVVNPDTGITHHREFFDQDKFAELIVRECILTIQMGITRDGRDTEKFLRSMKHIRQIQEHFGVE